MSSASSDARRATVNACLGSRAPVIEVKRRACRDDEADLASTRDGVLTGCYLTALMECMGPRLAVDDECVAGLATVVIVDDEIRAPVW